MSQGLKLNESFAIILLQLFARVFLITKCNWNLRVNKTKTVSFRVPENIISEIEKDARIKKVSTNILINQILFDYAVFHRYRQHMRIMPVSDDVTRLALNNLDSRRGDLAEAIYQNIKEWTLVSRMEFDFYSCIQALETFCRVSDLGFESSERDGVFSIVIKHDLGSNFSSLMIDLAEKIFWDLRKVKIESEKTKSAILIRTISSQE